jgi:ketosteroid isomerase-like protein
MSNSGTTAEAELQWLAQEWMDAVARRDGDTLDSLMADDFTLASGMGVFVEKPQWLDMALRRIVAKSFRYSDVRVRIYGECAVMQSWWSQQATIDGRD